MGKTCSFLRESNPKRTKRTPMKILEKSPCNISWLISAIEIPIKYINKIQSFLVMKCKNPRTDTVELGIIEFSKSQEGSFLIFFSGFSFEKIGFQWRLAGDKIRSMHRKYTRVLLGVFWAMGHRPLLLLGYRNLSQSKQSNYPKNCTAFKKSTLLFSNERLLSLQIYCIFTLSLSLSFSTFAALIVSL